MSISRKSGVDYIQISGVKWIKQRIDNLIYSDIGTKLAEKLNIPIMVIGGGRNLDELNEIINKSKIALIGLVRPLICEYDLVKKWKNGETKKSKCISCNTCLRKSPGICIFNKNKCDRKIAQPA